MEHHVKFMKEYCAVRKCGPLTGLSNEVIQVFLTASNVIMGDLLVCYYTLRVGSLYKEIRWPDPLDVMKDLDMYRAYSNLRILMTCIFVIRCEILREYSHRHLDLTATMVHGFDDCHRASDENTWFYRHYSTWCVHLVINYGVPLELLTIKAYSWKIMDVRYMCEAFGDAQSVLRGLDMTDAGIRHLYRPEGMPEKLFPTLRYMLDIEYRMRINNHGEEGHTAVGFRERSESILEEPETVATDETKEE